MANINEIHKKHLAQHNETSKCFTKWKHTFPEDWTELQKRVHQYDPTQIHWVVSKHSVKPSFGLMLAILYDWQALPEHLQPGLLTKDRTRGTVEKNFNWLHGALRHLYTQEEKDLRWRKIQAKKNGITWIDPEPAKPNSGTYIAPEQTELDFRPIPSEPKPQAQDPAVTLTLEVPASKVAAIMAVVNS